MGPVPEQVLPGTSTGPLNKVSTLNPPGWLAVSGGVPQGPQARRTRTPHRSVSRDQGASGQARQGGCSKMLPGRFWRPFGPGPPLGPPGPPWAPWAPLGPPGPPWAPLGPLGPPGPAWAPLGPPLAPLAGPPWARAQTASSAPALEPLVWTPCPPLCPPPGPTLGLGPFWPRLV